MENTPENKDFNIPEAKDNFAEEEFSSIFSAPVEHKKKNPNAKKKPWLIIAVAFLVVAALVGSTIAVIKLIPVLNDEEAVSSNDNSITVLDNDSDNYKAVTIKNSNGSFSFYPETVIEKSDSEEKNSTKTVNWYLDGYDKELLNTSAISVVVETSSDISATKEITKMTLEDCGLNEPEVIVDITDKDDKVFSILIGNNTPDNMSCYVKLSNSDKVFITDISIKQSFTFVALDFASNEALPSFNLTDAMGDYKADDGTLATFDSLTVSGKKFDTPVVIEPNRDEQLATLVAFVVTSPTRRIAENIDGVLNLFKSGITVTGAYSFDVTSDSLKAVGLDNPDFVATLSIMGNTQTFKFALQEDGNYAVICDTSKLISKVSASNVTFAGYKLTDFYSSWVCLVSIDTLESLVIENEGTVYDYKITKTIDEDENKEYSVTLNGKKVNFEKFQDFYQELISIACTDFTVDDVGASAPNIKFTFNFLEENGGGSTVTEFYKISETRYQYKTDGINLGKVNSSTLKKIFAEMDKIS